MNNIERWSIFLFERKNQKSNDIIEFILPLFSTQIFLMGVALLLGFGIYNRPRYLSGKTLNVFLKMYLRIFFNHWLLSLGSVPWTKVVFSSEGVRGRVAVRFVRAFTASGSKKFESGSEQSERFEILPIPITTLSLIRIQWKLRRYNGSKHFSGRP